MTHSTTLIVDRAAIRAVLDYLHDSEAEHYDSCDPEEQQFHVYRHVLDIEEDSTAAPHYSQADVERLIYAVEVERDRMCLTVTDFREKHGHELSYPLSPARWNLLTSALAGVGRPSMPPLPERRGQLSLDI